MALVRFIVSTIKKGVITLMRNRRNLLLAITLALVLSAPISAPAADTFKVILGDSGAGITRINASFKGSSGFGADIYLQPCTDSIKSDCISSFSHQSQNSTEWIKLVPDEKILFPVAGVPRFGSSPDVISEMLTAYPQDSARNFPAGGMSPVYRDINAANDDGMRYLLNARAQGAIGSDGIASWNDFRIEVIPVKIADYSKLNLFGFPTLQLQPSFQTSRAFKIEIKIKATKSVIAGWFYGRIFQPEIKFTSLANNEGLLEIIGSPITTHVAQGDITFTDYSTIQSSNQNLLRAVVPGTSAMLFGATYGFASEAGAMKVWRLLNSYTSDSASTSYSVFNLRTTKNYSGNANYYPQGCQSSEVLDGVVSTNATMYNPTPPTYDANDGSLSFEVGSPHLDPSGKVIQGNYSMVVSAKLAKCIWGSDLNDFKATVSIVNDSGMAQVTTSALKFLSDFYYFNISGFTYSTKKISIRLTAAPAPVVVPTPTPLAVAPIKRITCVKGNLKKYVSGVKPVCPKGYKVK